MLSLGTTHTTVEGGDCVWSLTVDNNCAADGDCAFPHYVDSALRTTLGGRKDRSSATWLGYQWYKKKSGKLFVDQPGMQHIKLTAAERDFMQKRVETFHRMTARKSRWLKPGGATKEGLAVVDKATLTTPPKGMEHGYGARRG
eukprot:gene6731-636_t